MQLHSSCRKPEGLSGWKALLYNFLIIGGAKMAKLTREEALRRWNAALATKRAAVEKMQKMLYEDYKLRTGEEPVGFNVL